jgi:UDP-N-acetylmuramyl pentapeptide phosphotransferase/UDP-N-acetylglucosamine-1-phosphate transferase
MTDRFPATHGAYAQTLIQRFHARDATVGVDKTWRELRKVHVFPTPRIGGIAIAAGCVASRGG